MAKTQKDQLSELDRLQRQDHDLIVRIEEVVKNIALDVKELKDGMTQRLAEMELEIEGNADGLNTLEKRVDRWEASMKAVKWTIGLIAASIAFVIANLSGAIELLRR